MSPSDPWAGILAADEDILWQAAPLARHRIEWRHPRDAAIALFMVGFSVFWMVSAAAGGGLFWMFGLIFFAIGPYELGGIHLWKAYLRRHTFYTVTTQRAFIATQVFGRRRLDAYPITDATHIRFEDNGDTGNIYFATRPQRRGRRMTEVAVGFEQLEEPREVLMHLRHLTTQNSEEGPGA